MDELAHLIGLDKIPEPLLFGIGWATIAVCVVMFIHAGFDE